MLCAVNVVVIHVAVDKPQVVHKCVVYAITNIVAHEKRRNITIVVVHVGGFFGNVGVRQKAAVVRELTCPLGNIEQHMILTIGVRVMHRAVGVNRQVVRKCVVYGIINIVAHEKRRNIAVVVVGIIRLLRNVFKRLGNLLE